MMIKICTLNSLHYVKLDFYMAGTKLTGDHLVEAVTNINLDMFKYILDNMIKEDVITNIERIEQILINMRGTLDEPVYISMLAEVQVKIFQLKSPEKDDYCYAIPDIIDSKMVDICQTTSEDELYW